MTTPALPVTRADLNLVRALASLAAHLPERLRSRHLAERAEALARRIEAVLPNHSQPEESSRCLVSTESA